MTTRFCNPSSLTPLNKCSGLDVAIVIAGRNSVSFLGEAVESALNQTVPCEVVYADDCSSDKSLSSLAPFLNRGLRVLPSSVHLGVCATRNRGAAATRSPNIIFMDSDDRMPPNYVAEMLADLAMNPNAPFIYPNTHAFGGFDTLWKNSPWDGYDVWSHNQVSTTSMWSRKAFDAAGRWHASVPSMWDYDLAIRCSRYGKPVAGRAVLDYRIHEGSVSSQLDERILTESIPYKELIRRKNATLGIGCLIGGRLPGLFPKWMDRLATSVRFADLSNKPKLLLLLHTKAQPYLNEFMSIAGRYSDTFSCVEFMFTPIESWTPTDTSPQEESSSLLKEMDRRIYVSNLLATSCSTLQSTLGTDVTWLIEDDILVPIRGCKYLFNVLTAGNIPPIGVSGCYYNRHPIMKGKLVGGWIKEGKHFEPENHFREIDIVDFVGTGCLMYWSNRPGTPKQWRSMSRLENATAHDWAWSEDVDGRLVMVGTVDCDHMITETEGV